MDFIDTENQRQLAGMVAKHVSMAREFPIRLSPVTNIDILTDPKRTTKPLP
jgi:hypothetical protein